MGDRLRRNTQFFVASLEELETAVSEWHGKVEFVRTAIAEEYRKTVAMRAERDAAKEADAAAPPAPIGDAQAQLEGIHKRWAEAG